MPYKPSAEKPISQFIAYESEGALRARYLTEEQTLTLWQRFRWWWWTRVPPRRCVGCACKALPEGTDQDDPRIGNAATHGTVERTYPWGLWVCYGCFHYGDG